MKFMGADVVGFLGGSTDSSVAEPNLCFFGDDHGRKAVVGRRDACWASGGSAVTNSLLSPLVCPGQRGGGQSGLSRVADRHELMAYGNLPSRGVRACLVQIVVYWSMYIIISK